MRGRDRRAWMRRPALTRRSVGLGLLGVLCLLCVRSAHAQEDAPAALERLYFDALEVGAGDGFDVELYLRAETDRGQPVELRPPWSLVIREDGRPVEASRIRVRPLEETREGVACLVVLDVSPTMSAVFERARASVLSFLDQLGPDDPLALVTASASPQLRAGFATALEETRVLVQGLEPEIDPSPTRLLDAIDLGLERMREDASLPTRRLLLVVSDGSDGGSVRGIEELLELAAPVDAPRTPVFVLELRDPAFGSRRAGVLAALVQQTGGTTLRDPSLTAAFYDDLWRRMRRSLVVRYASDMDGAMHRVEVITDGLVPPGERAAVFPLRVRGASRLRAAFGIAVAALLLLAWRVRRRARMGVLVVAGAGDASSGYRLKRGVNSIGSMPDNDIVIASPAVSRFHAVLHARRGGCRIEDCQSTNGTFVNDKPVGVAQVSPGDRVRVGDVELLYRS